jgi:hypothetical protein
VGQASADRRFDPGEDAAQHVVQHFAIEARNELADVANRWHQKTFLFS